MGGDHDAAVVAGGQCGLGLGAAPAATAAMAGIVARSGPATRAVLVVSTIGVFNDVTNVLIITTYLNLVR
jgi:ESS family glutamate:Na+ symporter